MDRGPIFVTLAPSPSDFYVRLTNREADLARFEKKLERKMKASEERNPQSRVPVPRAGDFYAAFIPEMDAEDRVSYRWRRVVVLASSRKGASAVNVRVRLIDVGSVKTVSSEGLRPLPAERDFFETPAFALPGRLVNVRPVGTTSSSSSWSRIACEYFSSLVKSAPLFFMDIDEGSAMSDCIGLDLFVLVAPKETAFSPKTVTVVSVTQALVDEGLAEWNRPEIMNEAGPVRASLPSGTPSLGLSLNPRWTSLKFLPSSDTSSADFGFEVTGIIRSCHLDSLTKGNSRIAIPTGGSGLAFHLFPLAQFSELAESDLQEEINSFCRPFAASRGDDIGGELQQDQAVFVLEDDGNWWRARSDFTSPNASRAQVIFLESGTRKSVTVSRIISVIPQPLLDIPQLTYEISLDVSSNVTPSATTISLLNDTFSGRLATFRFAPPFEENEAKALEFMVDGQQKVDLKRWFT